jgi:hypothetical protein
MGCRWTPPTRPRLRTLADRWRRCGTLGWRRRAPRSTAPWCACRYKQPPFIPSRPHPLIHVSCCWRRAGIAVLAKHGRICSPTCTDVVVQLACGCSTASRSQPLQIGSQIVITTLGEDGGSADRSASFDPHPSKLRSWVWPWQEHLTEHEEAETRARAALKKELLSAHAALEGRLRVLEGQSPAQVCSRICFHPELCVVRLSSGEVPPRWSFRRVEKLTRTATSIGIPASWEL